MVAGGMRGWGEWRASAFGARVLPGGGVRFRVWAPACRRVELLLDGALCLPMRPARSRGQAGWFSRVVLGARAGTRYRFVLDGAATIPDPASRCNPDGVRGDSEVVDTACWRRPALGLNASAATVATAGTKPGPGRRGRGWRGRPWHEAVICELHIGTFTPEGTFAAAAARLPELAANGFTAVQLMPVAAFAGERGWGYDGVLLMAPHAAYGRPQDLVHFVGEAHRLKMMVLGDLVLNHLGPQGNPWPACAAGFFDRGTDTPWGGSPAFDGPHAGPVRRFFIEAARHWVGAYGLDGLRLDAVHAVHDSARPDIVEAVTRAVREVGARQRRLVHVVLENDANEAWRLAGGDQADAQWNDDFQHAAQVILTGERHRHLADAAAHPHWLLARALAQGFGFQGERSGWRAGKPRGEPSDHLPPTAFINFLQTHDVVGNRADGQRLTPRSFAPGHAIDPDALRALTAIVLLSPSIPLLFMGQAWGATTPFHYFGDWDEPLASAVAAGRCREFSDDPGFGHGAAADPAARSTFERSRLDWGERGAPAGRAWLAFTRRLLRLRREHLWPALAGAPSGLFQGLFHVLAPGQLHVQWPLAHGAVLHLLANLHPHAAPLEAIPPGRVLWAAPRANIAILDGGATGNKGEQETTGKGGLTATPAGLVTALLPPWHVRFSIDADRPLAEH